MKWRYSNGIECTSPTYGFVAISLRFGKFCWICCGKYRYNGFSSAAHEKYCASVRMVLLLLFVCSLFCFFRGYILFVCITRNDFSVMFIATAKARCTHYVHIYFHMLVKHMRNRASLEFRVNSFSVCAAWLLFSLLYQVILLYLLFSCFYISFLSLHSISLLFLSFFLSLHPPPLISPYLSIFHNISYLLFFIHL